MRTERGLQGVFEERTVRTSKIARNNATREYVCRLLVRTERGFCRNSSTRYGNVSKKHRTMLAPRAHGAWAFLPEFFDAVTDGFEETPGNVGPRAHGAWTMTEIIMVAEDRWPPRARSVGPAPRQRPPGRALAPARTERGGGYFSASRLSRVGPRAHGAWFLPAIFECATVARRRTLDNLPSSVGSSCARSVGHHSAASSMSARCGHRERPAMLAPRAHGAWPAAVLYWRAAARWPLARMAVSGHGGLPAGRLSPTHRRAADREVTARRRFRRDSVRSRSGLGLLSVRAAPRLAGAGG